VKTSLKSDKIHAYETFQIKDFQQKENVKMQLIASFKSSEN